MEPEQQNMGRMASPQEQAMQVLNSQPQMQNLVAMQMFLNQQAAAAQAQPQMMPVQLQPPSPQTPSFVAPQQLPQQTALFAQQQQMQALALQLQQLQMLQQQQQIQQGLQQQQQMAQAKPEDSPQSPATQQAQMLPFFPLTQSPGSSAMPAPNAATDKPARKETTRPNRKGDLWECAFCGEYNSGAPVKCASCRSAGLARTWTSRAAHNKKQQQQQQQQHTTPSTPSSGGDIPLGRNSSTDMNSNSTPMYSPVPIHLSPVTLPRVTVGTAEHQAEHQAEHSVPPLLEDMEE